MRRGCLLVALIVAAATCANATAAEPHSGLSGRVLEAPVCPVERVPPQPGCAPRPLAATLRIRRLGGRTPARTVRAGADGRFRVLLVAGTYKVRALPIGGSPFPRAPQPRLVRVRAGRFTAITLVYDTGIR